MENKIILKAKDKETVIELDSEEEMKYYAKVIYLLGDIFKKIEKREDGLYAEYDMRVGTDEVDIRFSDLLDKISDDTSM